MEIDRLAPYPLLLLDSSFVFRRNFDAACRLAGFTPNIRFESRGPHTLLAMAERGHGVAVIPSALRDGPACAADRRPDLSRQSAARAAGALLGQAAPVTALRRRILRNASGAHARGVPCYAATQTWDDSQVDSAAPAAVAQTPMRKILRVRMPLEPGIL